MDPWWQNVRNQRASEDLILGKREGLLVKASFLICETGGTHSCDFWEDGHSAWHSVGVAPTELLLRVSTTDAGSLWSWPAHCRVRDLCGTPCRDTEDVSSELRAHPQGNWKRPAFSRAFSHHQCKTLATLQKKKQSDLHSTLFNSFYDLFHLT